jgi:hypothetical protein
MDSLSLQERVQGVDGNRRRLALVRLQAQDPPPDVEDRLLSDGDIGKGELLS